MLETERMKMKLNTLIAPVVVPKASDILAGRLRELIIQGEFSPGDFLPTERELGAFWRALEKQGAHVTTIAATKLLFLTMARKNELLRARWTEFDLAIGTWDVPAERMK